MAERPIGSRRNSWYGQLFRDLYYGSFMRFINYKSIGYTTLLDVGAGDGRFAEWAQDKNFKVQAIDVDPGMPWIKKADFLKSEYPDNSFDVVHCSHVLEHIPESKFIKFAEKLERVTSKYLIVLCPLPNKTFWDEPTHVRPYNAETLRRLFFRMKVLHSFEIDVPGFITTAGIVLEKRLHQ